LHDNYLYLSNNYFSSLVGTKFFGNFLVVFSDINSFNFILNTIKKFFLLKNVYFVLKYFSFSSIKQGFSFGGWKFFDTKNDFFLGQVSLENVKRHKLDLKTIVKSKLLSSNFYLVESLNNSIFYWLLNYSFSDSIGLYFSGLDVFI